MRLKSCVVRPFASGDVAALAELANNRRVWLNLRDRFPHPYTVADAQGWIDYAALQSPVTDFAIEVAGRFAGAVGVTPQADVHRISAEIGYWLGEPYWGRGVATEALLATTEYAFAQLGLLRLYATVFAYNPASARVLEKAGYVREAVLRKSVLKDGQVVDSWLYAKVR